jgi:hypothetical protein
VVARRACAPWQSCPVIYWRDRARREGTLQCGVDGKFSTSADGHCPLPGSQPFLLDRDRVRPVIAGDAVEVAGYRRQRRSHPGRQSLPAELPRVEKVITCPAEQCSCGQCGQPTTVIGYEESEQLEVEPAKYFVLVTKREKRGCTFCRKARIVTAPASARIIDKGLVSDRVVIDTVIRKYCDHLRCTGRM